MSASPEERARRRAAQRKTTEEGEAEQILDELRRRDAIDSSREIAPLRPAPDALLVNTDGNTFDQTVAMVVSAIRSAEGGAGGR